MKQIEWQGIQMDVDSTSTFRTEQKLRGTGCDNHHRPNGSAALANDAEGLSNWIGHTLPLKGGPAVGYPLAIEVVNRSRTTLKPEIEIRIVGVLPNFHVSPVGVAGTHDS